MKVVSDWLYRYTNRYTVIAFTVLLMLHILFFLPEDVDRIVGTGGGLLKYFRYFVYSPDDFYRLLDSIGEEGRAAFIDHRLIKATIFIFSFGAFFTIVPGALLRIGFRETSRMRLLNVVGLIPAFCDVVENHAQMVLVALYPERYDSAVLVVTTFTAIKWVTLWASMLILIIALLAAGVALLRR